MQSLLQYRRFQCQAAPPTNPALERQNGSPEVTHTGSPESAELKGNDQTQKNEVESCILVDWDGVLDPIHQRNWSPSSK